MKLTFFQAVLNAALKEHTSSLEVFPVPCSEEINFWFSPYFGENIPQSNHLLSRWAESGLFSKKNAKLSSYFFCLWLVAAAWTGHNTLGWIFAIGSFIMLILSFVSNLRLPRLLETPYQKNRDSSLLKEYPALSWPALDTVYTKIGLMNDLRGLSFTTQDIHINKYYTLLDSYGLHGAEVIDFLDPNEKDQRDEFVTTYQGLIWQYANGKVVIISLLNIPTTTDLIHAVGAFCVGKGEIESRAGNWVSCNFNDLCFRVAKEWYDANFYLREDFLKEINNIFQKGETSEPKMDSPPRYDEPYIQEREVSWKSYIILWIVVIGLGH